MKQYEALEQQWAQRLTAHEGETVRLRQESAETQRPTVAGHPPPTSPILPAERTLENPAIPRPFHPGIPGGHVPDPERYRDTAHWAAAPPGPHPVGNQPADPSPFLNSMPPSPRSSTNPPRPPLLRRR